MKDVELGKNKTSEGGVNAKKGPFDFACYRRGKQKMSKKGTKSSGGQWWI